MLRVHGGQRPSSAARASTPSRSAPMVVESPWPVWTTVWSGSVEQRVADRAQDGRFVAVAPAGGAGAAAEERVAAEHDARVGVVEAAAAGGVAGRVQHRELVAADVQRRARRQVTIRRVVGPDHVPQHPVVGVQQDRGVDGVAQRHGRVDVVVVPVGEHDRGDLAAVDGVTIGSWSCAASNTTTSRSSPTIQMLLVTSHSPPSSAKIPSVVTSSIHQMRQNTTTLRSTSPRSILWNASSTSSRPIVSDTKPSRSRRPWR
jgi:hypothetical protein